MGTMFFIRSSKGVSHVQDFRGRSRCTDLDRAVRRDDRDLGPSPTATLMRAPLGAASRAPWGKAGRFGRSAAPAWTLARRAPTIVRRVGPVPVHDALMSPLGAG